MAVNRRLEQAYGFGQGIYNLSPKPIVAQRAPTVSDFAEIGTIWCDQVGEATYILVKVAGNEATWLDSAGGAGTFDDLTVNPGPTDLTGDVTVTAAVASTVDIDSGTGGSTLSSTGLTTISSSRANSSAINLTASSGNGGINIVAANGSVVAQYRSTGETHTLTNLPWTLETGTGDINISNNGSTTDVFIGTGGGVKEVTIGSEVGTSTTALFGGTGGVVLTSPSNIEISGDTQACTVHVGDGAAAKTLTVGSFTVGSTTNIFAPPTTGIGLSNGAQNANILVGSGVPGMAAPKGSLYINTTATTTTTRLYINTDGASTWTNFTTAA